MLLIILSQEIGYEVHLGVIYGGHVNLVFVEVDLSKGGNGIHFYFLLYYWFFRCNWDDGGGRRASRPPK